MLDHHLGRASVLAHLDPADAAMTIGTVKWFDAMNGLGFITPDDGSIGAFVHVAAVSRAGLAKLSAGQRVCYERVLGMDGRYSAENLASAG